MHAYRCVCVCCDIYTHVNPECTMPALYVRESMCVTKEEMMLPFEFLWGCGQFEAPCPQLQGFPSVVLCEREVSKAKGGGEKNRHRRCVLVCVCVVCLLRGRQGGKGWEEGRAGGWSRKAGGIAHVFISERSH